jgi:hypothetical protein
MSSTKLCPWTTLSVREVLEVSVTVNALMMFVWFD